MKEKITGYQYGQIAQKETVYESGAVIRTQPQAKFIEEGVAHLIYPAELDAYTLNHNTIPPRPGRELTPYFDSIERLQLQVAIPDYRGAEYSEAGEPQTFDLTQ